MAKKTTTKKTSKAKTVKIPDGVKMRRRIAVPLNSDELALKGQAAANFASVLQEQKTQYTQVKKDWSAKISDTEQKRDFALLAIREGKEDREIDVIMTKNYDDNQVQFFRATDGKLLESREMKAEERQMEIEESSAATGKTKQGTRRVRDIIKKTAESRDMNAEDNGVKSLMMPGAKAGLKLIDKTVATNDEEKSREIAEVHSMETKRSSKKSSVDETSNKSQH